MMMNVKIYCTSLTAKENRGGTKKKSKEHKLNTAARAAAPRPKRTATSTTVRMNIATIFDRSNRAASGIDSSVTATHASVAHRYRSCLNLRRSLDSAPGTAGKEDVLASPFCITPSA